MLAIETAIQLRPLIDKLKTLKEQEYKAVCEAGLRFQGEPAILGSLQRVRTDSYSDAAGWVHGTPIDMSNIENWHLGGKDHGQLTVHIFEDSSLIFWLPESTLLINLPAESFAYVSERGVRSSEGLWELFKGDVFPAVELKPGHIEFSVPFSASPTIEVRSKTYVLNDGHGRDYFLSN